MFTEILRYFAKFSTREGVLKNFSTGTSQIAGYDQLREDLSSLQYLDLVPEFIFSPHLDKVRSRVSGILSSLYLFVDYGEISHEISSPGQYSDEIALAVTVAYPSRDSSADSMEQLLLMEDCLKRLVSIRNEILSIRCNADPFYKGIVRSHQIIPFEAPELSSVGWTMTFSRQGFDSLRAKPV
ncbi:hypothetical protein CS543_06910 [Porphyromonas gingivalis]|uniref:Uncharacterized protein n=1 Tax=Porphyromonas phage phage032a_KCOM2801 TaxID=3154122 RepID=A0AAT9JN87_9CAUD|nr:hypothetical protein [Porphyromonas gingivalis]ATS10596.1 hypothetical protein CS543_06910 [Porphyromonas gingivalis]